MNSNTNEIKSDDSILQEICMMLEPFNKKKITLEEETDIASDLDIDSVAILDFIMEVEDKFEVVIPMNRISEIRTIQELVAAIHELRGKTEGG